MTNHLHTTFLVICLDSNFAGDRGDPFDSAGHFNGLVGLRLGSGESAQNHFTLVGGINLDMDQIFHLFIGQHRLDLGRDDRVLDESQWVHAIQVGIFSIACNRGQQRADNQTGCYEFVFIIGTSLWVEK